MKTIWLGLEAPLGVFHYPMIRIQQLDVSIPKKQFSHVIFTSKTTVDILKDLPKDLTVLAVGKKTAQKAKDFQNIVTASHECAEGVIELLKLIDPKNTTILYPHSKKARSLIVDYLKDKNFNFESVAVYDVQFQALEPKPCLTDFEKIVFTSPSCVDAFFFYFKTLPKHLLVDCIGHVTQHHLTKMLANV